MESPGKVYLIPSVLSEEGIAAIPLSVPLAIKDCQVFFVENERTARRYLKQLWKAFLPGQDIVIDNYEWHIIPETPENPAVFLQRLKEGKNIGIISEAGCPGIADPGQSLVAAAQQRGIEIRPLTGPNSIILALMASGMNGQQFQFVGYLPIASHEKIKRIRELEAESKKKNCTKVFIETPYRNNQMMETLLANCNPSTRLCVAVDLTGKSEQIKTQTIAAWKNEKPDIHKRPAIFLLLAAH